MEETKKKPSYEELNNYCNQLMMQRNQLKEQYDKAIRELNQLDSVLTKLPWLFKVLELENHFDPDFVISCADEIQLIMTPPAQEPKEEVPNEE